MTAFSLILFPADAQAAMPGPVVFHEHLRRIGLAGDRIQNNDFLAGERFLQLVMFMGCSPNIGFEPGTASGSFTCIRILSDGGRILCRISPSKRPPRCPACDTPLGESVASAITASSRCGRETTCPSCGTAHLPWQLTWHKNAGFGRCLIEITDIYPQEARPQPDLLDHLHAATGTPWRYFYRES